jgi:L-alanine-DL-glutamate epimerase-like enolase superfamily enzyme
VSPELSISVVTAVPNSVFVEYIPQPEPLLTRPLIRRDGYGFPFETPGHGIDIDPDALERFTVRRETRQRARDEPVAVVSQSPPERTR